MGVKIVIPSRYGSSRLEGKPLLKINGKPMVCHVVDRCIEAGVAQLNVFVATDDIRIQSALRQYEINCIMTSIEHCSGTDRVNQVAKLQGWPDDDIIINVQGDEPLIPPELISLLVSFSETRCEFDITTAVVPITLQKDFYDTNVVKVILGEGDRAIYFTRSACPVNRDNPQDMSRAIKHIGIYAYSVASLRKFCSYEESTLENYEKLEQLRALSHGMSIGAICYQGMVSHGVDTLSDFKLVKKMME